MNTTIEVMARAVHAKVLSSLRVYHKKNANTAGKGLGAITSLHIKMDESDVASASYWEADAGGLFTSQRKV